MDPLKTTNLDPKLKEAYDRVMGLNNTPAPSAPEAPAPAKPVEPAAPVAPTPTMPQPVSDPNFIPPQPAATPTPPLINTPTQSVNVGTVFKSKTDKPKNKMLMPLIIVGGVIFFVAYAVVFAKIFGLF